MLVRHILPWPHRHIHQPRSVYSTSLVTQSRFAGSSCPAPLLLFVFFCFLLLETEHLMEKACSPAPCAGNTRFLPPLPGTAPGAVQAAVPAATCSCCPASGSPYGGSGGGRERSVRGHGRDRPGPSGTPLSALRGAAPAPHRMEQGRAVVFSRQGVCMDHQGTTQAQVPSACQAQWAPGPMPCSLHVPHACPPAFSNPFGSWPQPVLAVPHCPPVQSTGGQCWVSK